MSRARVVMGAALVALVLGAAGFALGRQVGGEEGSPPAAAAGTPSAPAATPAAAAPTATPAGGVDPYTGLPLEPDTTKPLWYVPYSEAESRLPLFEGTLAGVRIEPSPADGVDGASSRIAPCASYLPPGSRSLADIADSPVAIRTPGIPGVVAQPGEVRVVACADGRAVAAEATFSLLPHPGGAPRGGDLWVFRYLAGDPSKPVAHVQLRAPRVREARVGGGPAVLAVPPLPRIGFGPGAVVAVPDGVVTVITSQGLTEEALLAAAEELLK